ncbi:hypothetical protein Hanom_Chr06g00549591 [Helianthus anomalus]
MNLAASSRLVFLRTTNGAGVIKSPTTFPSVLLSSFCASLNVCNGFSDRMVELDMILNYTSSS